MGKKDKLGGKSASSAGSTSTHAAANGSAKTAAKQHHDAASSTTASESATGRKRPRDGENHPSTSGNGASSNTKQKKDKSASAAAASASAASALRATAPIPAAAMNAVHTSSSTVQRYADIFRAGKPFPHIQVKNLFPEGVLQQVRSELLAGTYFQKRNDLYDFLQTDDLKRAQGNAIASLRQYIYSRPFRSWIESITGVETNDTIDASAAQYIDTSHLLCHDDDLSSRRIAYIIYLVPEDWTAEDGGALDLFNVDGNGHPDGVVASITPAWNSIAFFEVSPLSYHQVAEVLDDTKGPRLSISGWFHGAMPTGPAYVRPPHPVPPRPRYVHPAAAEDDEVDEEHDAAEKEEEEQLAVHATPLPSSSSSSSASPSASSSTTASSPSSSLAHWINPTYLKASIIPQMRASYTRDASLSLESFLREDRYAELYTAMGHQRWTHVGPAVLRSYKQLQGDGGEVGTGFETDCTGAPVQRPSPSSSSSSSAATGQSVVTRYNSVLPDSVRLFQSFITSPAFYHYIAAITGSDLDGVSSEFRAFAHGDYTMLSDTTYKASLKQQKAEERGLAPKPTAASASSSAAAPAGDDAGAASIDVTLCCVQSPEEWPDEAGGYVTYMTADDELLSIPPKANNLSIVCKEPGVMSFVKFVSHRADETRYDVAMSFKTRGDGDGE